MILKFNLLSNKTPWLVLTGAIVLMVAARLVFGPTASTNRRMTVTCAPRSLIKQVAAADLIVTGQVFLVVPNGNIADVIITPDRVYKGELTRSNIHLAATPTTNGAGQAVDSSGRLHFDSSQPPYLLFLRNGIGGAFTTDSCSGTRFLGVGLTPDETALLVEDQPALLDD